MSMHRAGQRCFELLALIGSPQLSFSKVFPAEQTSWPNWQTLRTCTEADAAAASKNDLKTFKVAPIDGIYRGRLKSAMQRSKHNSVRQALYSLNTRLGTLPNLATID